MRQEIFPDPILQAKLNEESKRKGVSISVLVVDALNDYYGLSNSDTISIAELEAQVLDEIAEYISDPDNDYSEFDLNEASQTYAQIGMTCGGKPKADKARIGRAFAKRIGQPGRFENVEQIFLPNGKPKRSVGNRAAMYRVADAGQAQEMPDEDIDATLADMFPNAETDEELDYEMECWDNA